MAKIHLKGNPVQTIGEMPNVGEKAPDFVLTRTDLSDISLNDLAGKKAVLNIFPSVDTPVCAASVRKFNAEIDQVENVIVLCISRDLPFALSRFCGAEGLENVVPASEMRNWDFGDRYGVRMMNGPLAGLLARAVVILDAEGTVVYTQLVPEITQEPPYEEVLNWLKEE